MERYNLCNAYEKKALDSIYEYLGFNEVVSFEVFLDFVFYNSVGTISFNQIFNRMLKHIVTSFWEDHPEYNNTYIKIFWINPIDIDDYTKPGKELSYDPKGILRSYVKSNFKKLARTIR
jgi:hypothetical protein